MIHITVIGEFFPSYSTKCHHFGMLCEWRKWEDTNNLYCSSIIYVKRCLPSLRHFWPMPPMLGRNTHAQGQKDQHQASPAALDLVTGLGTSTQSGAFDSEPLNTLKNTAFFLHAFSFEGNFCLEDRPNYWHNADEALHCITLHFLGTNPCCTACNGVFIIMWGSSLHEDIKQREGCGSLLWGTVKISQPCEGARVKRENRKERQAPRTSKSKRTMGKRME